MAWGIQEISSSSRDLWIGGGLTTTAIGVVALALRARVAAIAFIWIGVVSLVYGLFFHDQSEPSAL